jgi:hypothetical protein
MGSPQVLGPPDALPETRAVDIRPQHLKLCPTGDLESYPQHEAQFQAAISGKHCPENSRGVDDYEARIILAIKSIG